MENDADGATHFSPERIERASGEEMSSPKLRAQLERLP